MREPSLLSKGKDFHKRVQEHYSFSNNDGKINNEHIICNDKDIESKSKRRIDILVNQLDDMVSVIEIKNSDWDRIKNIKKIFTLIKDKYGDILMSTLFQR